MSEATIADAPPDRGLTASGAGTSRYSFRENEAKWQRVWRERHQEAFQIVAGYPMGLFVSEGGGELILGKHVHNLARDQKPGMNDPTDRE